jgi:hypothetical protein
MAAYSGNAVWWRLGHPRGPFLAVIQAVPGWRPRRLFLAEGGRSCIGCGYHDLLKLCDHAVNTLQRNENLTYATL